MNIKTNILLNSNPASLSRPDISGSGSLYVYRKRQHHGNTTPAGVEQPMVALHFYKHLMPPASVKNSSFDSFKDIQKKLGLAHREYFRKFYLKPALESGLIEMTIFGKPNSKIQNYRLTEKGKLTRNG